MTGFFRAVHKRDGVGQEYDGAPFVDSNLIDSAVDCGGELHEVLVLGGIEGGEWILACSHDLTFQTLSPPCQDYSQARGA